MATVKKISASSCRLSIGMSLTKVGKARNSPAAVTAPPVGSSRRASRNTPTPAPAKSAW
jgi:hypothetical protein